MYCECFHQPPRLLFILISYLKRVEDKTVRYVAEENIQIIEPDVSDIPTTLFNFSGKYFKRWDSATRRFVSNIRDEYPDD